MAAIVASTMPYEMPLSVRKLSVTGRNSQDGIRRSSFCVSGECTKLMDSNNPRGSSEIQYQKGVIVSEDTWFEKNTRFRMQQVGLRKTMSNATQLYKVYKVKNSFLAKTRRKEKTIRSLTHYRNLQQRTMQSTQQLSLHTISTL